MGNKEDEVKEEPNIEGVERGIENKGAFNFYDGTIRGKMAIEGTVNDTPEGYNVVIGKNEYKTKKALTSAISTFKTAINTGRFFIVKDKNDSYQFKLYNQDKRCIVIGEAYKNKNQAISAAKSVISFVNSSLLSFTLLSI